MSFNFHIMNVRALVFTLVSISNVYLKYRRHTANDSPRESATLQNVVFTQNFFTNLRVVAPLMGYVEGGLNGTAVGIESSSKQLLIESLKYM
jgi:hypothetical protein